MRVGEYFDGGPIDIAAPATRQTSHDLPPDDPRAAEKAALAALGIGKPFIRRLDDRAGRNGTSIEAELLADGTIREDAYFAAMARLLRLPFIATIEPGSLVDTQTLDVQLLRPNLVRLVHARAVPQVAIVPEAMRLAELAARLDRLPELGRGLAITTPSAIRNAVWTAGAPRRVQAAVTGLFEARATSSARIVLSGMQGFVAGGLAVMLLVALLWVPASLTALHAALSFFYLGTLMPRFAALIHRKRKVARPTPDNPTGPLPVYTVMVALYREAAVVEQLVRSLERLDWPPALLDIKLVCEGDDTETIGALEALVLRPHFEIVRVPPCQPRTKPKALTYALGAARGEFLTIYDAEDRPHPQQLREAVARFRSGPDDLACLQAPLVITNGQQSFVSALFAVEYSALFRAVLPMLATFRMPLPLGGTSNHFKTAALHDVGGWDPFNVTEDADLGMRLYRQGYRAGTLRRQTLEDAPTTLGVWLGQRTRWYKGWVQTWLVIMRTPRTHIREMGLGGAIVFQLMIGGMLVSALLHPLVLVMFVAGIEAMTRGSSAAIQFINHPLIVVDAMNVICSYVLFVIVGVRSMTEHERRLIGWRWAAVPFYWMMTSLAAWKAVNELRTKPFFWNKTPHKPAGKEGP